MMLRGLLLLFIPLLSCASTSFQDVMKSMQPVDKFSTLETDYADPLYRSLQLQYRTGGSDSLEINGASRATVKLDLLAWGQKSQEKNLKQEYLKLAKTINIEGSSRECLFRSLLLVNSQHAQKSLALLEILHQSYQDQNKILKKGIGENLYEFKELLSVHEKSLKNQTQINSLKKLKSSIKSALDQRLERPIELEEIDFNNFLTVKKIKTTNIVTEPKKIELAKLNSLAKIAELELDIEKREANQILDSVELYRWDDKVNADPSYGVQISFNIPFFNKRTYMKDWIQRQVAVNKLSAGQREVLKEIDGTELSFKDKIEQFDALRESDYLKTLKGLKKLLSGLKNNSPLLILQTNEKMALERLKLLDLKREITEEYLVKLMHSGHITDCSSPTYLVKN